MNSRAARILNSKYTFYIRSASATNDGICDWDNNVKKKNETRLSIKFYNQATSNLAIYSHETSEDKLSEA